jgi:hypothetical protein
VVVKNEVRVSINDKALRRYLRARCPHSIDLGEKYGRIENHTRSEETLYMRAENSTGEEAQCRFDTINDDSMSRVVSSLKANYPVGSLSKNVDDLSLSLIAPLGTYDHDA